VKSPRRISSLRSFPAKTCSPARNFAVPTWILQSHFSMQSFDEFKVLSFLRFPTTFKSSERNFAHSFLRKIRFQPRLSVEAPQFCACRNPLKVHLQYTSAKLLLLIPHLNGSFNYLSQCNNPKAFSKFVLAFPAVFRFCAGSLDVLAMLLHHLRSSQMELGFRD
jgi:hypothetical protein